MVNHRLQIRLDENRYEKVAREAERCGESLAAVIRRAIDLLPTDLFERQEALRALLAADPMPVPDDPADLRRELDEAHDRFPD